VTPWNEFADDWAELGRVLGEMSASGHAEVRKDAEWLAELGALHCDSRREGKSAVVRLWSDERNLRRVLRVKESSENRILLEVSRFGNKNPARLNLYGRTRRVRLHTSPESNSARVSD